MGRYIIISGFDTKDNNRGTAALGYGALYFCHQQGYLKKGQELLNFKFVKKFWKKQYKGDVTESYHAGSNVWVQRIIHVFELEKWILLKFHILLPFTKFGKSLRETNFVACINGGDGFSDIYSTKTFHSRLFETRLAMICRIPVIQLPQTLGPFKEKENYGLARKILQYSKDIYIRDDKFIPELEDMGVKYHMSKDLSAFMQPEPWDIMIPAGCIGINISGLCYSNRFRSLSGQFGQYPNLIDRLIGHFRKKGKVIYLIPHSYHYGIPEEANDDMAACRSAYERLKDKSDVFFVDKDLTSPQVKYVISKMSFFIGTRMHANFAAIYTGVPLFGLAYSYKFEGAFNANGLDGNAQTAMVNNINENDINNIINKIDSVYQKYNETVSGS